MTKHLRDILKAYWKQHAPNQKIRKSNLLIYDEFLKKYVSADELLIPAVKKDDINGKNSLNKSKEFILFDLLLKKFINPKLDILTPGIKNVELTNVCDFRAKQESFNTSSTNYFWGKRKKNTKHCYPALPPVHDTSKDAVEVSSKVGWAGQITNQPITDPRPEHSKTNCSLGPGKGPKRKKPKRKKSGGKKYSTCGKNNKIHEKENGITDVVNKTNLKFSKETGFHEDSCYSISKYVEKHKPQVLDDGLDDKTLKINSQDNGNKVLGGDNMLNKTIVKKERKNIFKQLCSKLFSHGKPDEDLFVRKENLNFFNNSTFCVKELQENKHISQRNISDNKCTVLKNTLHKSSKGTEDNTQRTEVQSDNKEFKSLPINEQDPYKVICHENKQNKNIKGKCQENKANALRKPIFKDNKKVYRSIPTKTNSLQLCNENKPSNTTKHDIEQNHKKICIKLPIQDCGIVNDTIKDNSCLVKEKDCCTLNGKGYRGNSSTKHMKTECKNVSVNKKTSVKRKGSQNSLDIVKKRREKKKSKSDKNLSVKDLPKLDLNYNFMVRPKASSLKCLENVSKSAGQFCKSSRDFPMCNESCKDSSCIGKEDQEVIKNVTKANDVCKCVGLAKADSVESNKKLCVKNKIKGTSSLPLLTCNQRDKLCKEGTIRDNFQKYTSKEKNNSKSKRDKTLSVIDKANIHITQVNINAPVQCQKIDPKGTEQLERLTQEKCIGEADLHADLSTYKSDKYMGFKINKTCSEMQTAKDSSLQESKTNCTNCSQSIEEVVSFAQKEPTLKKNKTVKDVKPTKRNNFRKSKSEMLLKIDSSKKGLSQKADSKNAPMRQNTGKTTSLTEKRKSKSKESIVLSSKKSSAKLSMKKKRSKSVKSKLKTVKSKDIECSPTNRCNKFCSSSTAQESSVCDENIGDAKIENSTAHNTLSVDSCCEKSMALALSKETYKDPNVQKDTDAKACKALTTEHATPKLDIKQSQDVHEKCCENLLVVQEDCCLGNKEMFAVKAKKDLQSNATKSKLPEYKNERSPEDTKSRELLSEYGPDGKPWKRKTSTYLKKTKHSKVCSKQSRAILSGSETNQSISNTNHREIKKGDSKKSLYLTKSSPNLSKVKSDKCLSTKKLNSKELDRNAMACSKPSPCLKTQKKQTPASTIKNIDYNNKNVKESLQSNAIPVKVSTSQNNSNEVKSNEMCSLQTLHKRVTGNPVNISKRVEIKSFGEQKLDSNQKTTGLISHNESKDLQKSERKLVKVSFEVENKSNKANLNQLLHTRKSNNQNITFKQNVVESEIGPDNLDSEDWCNIPLVSNQNQDVLCYKKNVGKFSLPKENVLDYKQYQKLSNLSNVNKVISKTKYLHCETKVNPILNISTSVMGKNDSFLPPGLNNHTKIAANVGIKDNKKNKTQPSASKEIILKNVEVINDKLTGNYKTKDISSKEAKSLVTHNKQPSIQSASEECLSLKYKPVGLAKGGQIFSNRKNIIDTSLPYFTDQERLGKCKTTTKEPLYSKETCVLQQQSLKINALNSVLTKQLNIKSINNTLTKPVKAMSKAEYKNINENMKPLNLSINVQNVNTTLAVKTINEVKPIASIGKKNIPYLPNINNNSTLNPNQSTLGKEKTENMKTILPSNKHKTLENNPTQLSNNNDYLFVSLNKQYNANHNKELFDKVGRFDESKDNSKGKILKKEEVNKNITNPHINFQDSNNTISNHKKAQDKKHKLPHEYLFLSCENRKPQYTNKDKLILWPGGKKRKSSVDTCVKLNVNTKLNNKTNVPISHNEKKSTIPFTNANQINKKKYTINARNKYLNTKEEPKCILSKKQPSKNKTFIIPTKQVLENTCQSKIRNDLLCKEETCEKSQFSSALLAKNKSKFPNDVILFGTAKCVEGSNEQTNALTNKIKQKTGQLESQASGVKESSIQSHLKTGLLLSKLLISRPKTVDFVSNDGAKCVVGSTGQINKKIRPKTGQISGQFLSNKIPQVKNNNAKCVEESSDQIHRKTGLHLGKLSNRRPVSASVVLKDTAKCVERRTGQISAMLNKIRPTIDQVSSQLSSNKRPKTAHNTANSVGERSGQINHKTGQLLGTLPSSRPKSSNIVSYDTAKCVESSSGQIRAMTNTIRHKTGQLSNKVILNERPINKVFSDNEKYEHFGQRFMDNKDTLNKIRSKTNVKYSPENTNVTPNDPDEKQVCTRGLKQVQEHLLTKEQNNLDLKTKLHVDQRLGSISKKDPLLKNKKVINISSPKGLECRNINLEQNKTESLFHKTPFEKTFVVGRTESILKRKPSTENTISMDQDVATKKSCKDKQIMEISKFIHPIAKRYTKSNINNSSKNTAEYHPLRTPKRRLVKIVPP